ncbi:carbohydrate kinase [Thermotoga sp. Ku-13t]|uniref:xylulokinase n=1 Tax=Thermotoga sp. Ku-13t TaxID=1755813 RepID=UPI0013EBF25F|nr:FGGY-family carbohydrate kinase [Thermotoga sp. Ku-13t]KAF2958912.1 carbohydrate kinase [Thermotoga sp. Ku-13t]
MSSELVMAVDIGTTNVKLTLFDLEGRKFFHFERKCTEDVSGGRHEIDPKKWWTAFVRGVHSVDEKLKTRVRAICASSQGPTIVLVDERGQLVRRAIGWLDDRGKPHMAFLKSQGLDEQTASATAKLIELRKELEGKAYLLQPSDFLIFKLAGRVVNATFRQYGYSPWYSEVLERFDLSQTFMIPELIEPSNVVGRIQQDVARRLGLTTDVIVVAGAPDFAAALVGTNTLKPGIACDRAGTSEGITLCSELEIRASGLITTPFFIEPFWKVSGLLTTSGKAIEWMTNRVARFRNLRDLSLSEIRRPTGVIFLPHLAGERSPYWNPNLRGVLFGLGLDVNAKTLIVSAAEGVAFAVKHIVETMRQAGAKVETVRTTGGQASNDLWNQIKADVLGMNVEVTRPDAELFGCAILAISCLTGESFVEVAERLVKVKKHFKPDPEKHTAYEKLYKIYLELHERNLDLFDGLGS